MEEILRKLVAFPTVTGDEQSMHEALDYVAGFVVARGMRVQRFDSNGFESLVATVKPGDRTPKVMLVAHLDVVPADEAMFDLRVEDGKYYGRGVLDMKFALAAYLQIIDEIQDELEQYDIGLMVTSDEEVAGANGVAMLVREGFIPKVAIIPDGGDNWQIQLTSKGILTLKITTAGKTAHGSRPWLGQNAILPLMDTIRDIVALFPDNNAKSNTVSVGKIQGGEAHNQVADHAEAFLDIRLTSDKEKSWILPMVEKVCQRYGADTQIITEGTATKFNLHDPLIAPFAKLINEVTGIEIHGSHTLGSNDARFFAEHDVPCISLYPTGGGHHSPEEWLDQQAFFDFKEILWRYLQQIAKR